MMPGSQGTLACIERLGFSAPCARTWNFNVENTRRECFGTCLASWIEGEAATVRSAWQGAGVHGSSC